MGAMLFGGVNEERVQYKEESLWVGDEIDTAAYQNFGEFVVRFRGGETVTNPSNHNTSPDQGVNASCDGSTKPNGAWKTTASFRSSGR